MSSIEVREAVLGTFGVLSVGALAYGAAIGNVWALVAGTYAAAVVLIVWLGGRRRRRR
jgi:O-antigen/teichoic acid export membrane protein